MRFVDLTNLSSKGPNLSRKMDIMNVYTEKLKDHYYTPHRTINRSPSPHLLDMT